MYICCYRPTLLPPQRRADSCRGLQEQLLLLIRLQNGWTVLETQVLGFTDLLKVFEQVTQTLEEKRFWGSISDKFLVRLEPVLFVHALAPDWLPQHSRHIKLNLNCPWEWVCEEDMSPATAHRSSVCLRTRPVTAGMDSMKVHHAESLNKPATQNRNSPTSSWGCCIWRLISFSLLSSASEAVIYANCQG